MPTSGTVFRCASFGHIILTDARRGGPLSVIGLRLRTSTSRFREETQEETMIRGVHTMFYSSEVEALRAFMRDKLGFRSTDVGGGWLIFDLPEADMGCHPADDEKGAALRDARHLILLRRHRANGRRACGSRR